MHGVLSTIESGEDRVCKNSFELGYDIDQGERRLLIAQVYLLF